MIREGQPTEWVTGLMTAPLLGRVMASRPKAEESKARPPRLLGRKRPIDCLTWHRIAWLNYRPARPSLALDCGAEL